MDTEGVFMLKGYQKKIVCLKNTGSPLFEEAYFIVRADVPAPGGSHTLVEEANRIIARNSGEFPRFRRHTFPAGWLAFTLGAAVTAFLCALLYLLL